MREIFEDVVQIKSNNTQVVMIGNGKLMNKTAGDFDSKEIQALIGKAIQKKFLPFKFDNNTSNVIQKSDNKTMGRALELNQDKVTKGLTVKEVSYDIAEYEKTRLVQINKNKNGKTKEKSAYQLSCKEPEVEVDSSNGKILKLCSNQNVSEWKSLSLLGQTALQNHRNKFQNNYSHLFESESDIGLKLYADLKKGE